EPVREPQQVAGQGLIGQWVQAARQRARHGQLAVLTGHDPVPATGPRSSKTVLRLRLRLPASPPPCGTGPGGMAGISPAPESRLLVSGRLSATLSRMPWSSNRPPAGSDCNIDHK